MRVSPQFEGSDFVRNTASFIRRSNNRLLASGDTHQIVTNVRHRLLRRKGEAIQYKKMAALHDTTLIRIHILTG